MTERDRAHTLITKRRVEDALSYARLNHAAAPEAIFYGGMTAVVKEAVDMGLTLEQILMTVRAVYKE